MVRFVLLAALAVAPAVTAADPLVKPAKPPAGFVRVRFPVDGEAAILPGTVTAPAAAPKGKPTVTAVRVAVTSAATLATVKRLAALGVKAEAGKPAVIPELVLDGWAGAVPARVKLTNLRVDAVARAFGSEDKLDGADFWLNLDQLTAAPAGQSELWATFGERTEFAASYPPAAVRKLKPTDDAPPPAAPELKPEDDRVPVAITLQPGGYQVAPTELNGTPMKLPGFSNFDVMLTGDVPGYVSNRTLGDHKLKLEPDSIRVSEDGAGRAAKYGTAAVPTVRYAAGAGAGYKTPRELRFGPSRATLAEDNDAPSYSIGPAFLRAVGGARTVVLAVGTDGVPRVYAVLPKNRVADPKKK